MKSLSKRRAMYGPKSFVRKPRKRTMPLVLKPFENCFQEEAKAWNVFIPSLDVTNYMENLNTSQETELRNRAENLSWRARKVQWDSASEFYWEASAWHDVFGLMNNDDDIRVDKRPYQYVETDSTGKLCVKTRIPDATFGIRAFEHMQISLGIPVYRKDAKRKPEPLLWDLRLNDMMHNPQCGLVVDGLWGESCLIFPFAAYEAKNGNECSDLAVTRQIHHACRTYLAMLDDLARNPNNVSEYQTNESSQFQFFAFTSISRYWTVYVAWSSLEDCYVEAIWKGDISKVSHALELIYIMDQIHDYAINQHFPFVLKHLEAWCAREKQNPVPPNLLFNNPEKYPLWRKLSEESKQARQEKSRETRKRNRKLDNTAQKEAKRRRV